MIINTAGTIFAIAVCAAFIIGLIALHLDLDPALPPPGERAAGPRGDRGDVLPSPVVLREGAPRAEGTTGPESETDRRARQAVEGIDVSPPPLAKGRTAELAGLEPGVAQPGGDRPSSDRSPTISPFSRGRAAGDDVAEPAS